MNPSYDVSTINGRVMGYGEPLRVRAGQRVAAPHPERQPDRGALDRFCRPPMQVIALDGNQVPQPKTVSMLRLAPAERASAIVEMNNPGVWMLGEVRKHVQAAGMGIVVEYAGSTGKPQWQQPQQLSLGLLRNSREPAASQAVPEATEIPLVFTPKFAGHGALDHWAINGKSFPDTDSPAFTAGQRYRLIFLQPQHQTIILSTCIGTALKWRASPAARELRGLIKDTVLVDANTEVEVELTADNPGPTLFHCHQQDHMDMGFMMLFHYA